MSFDNGPSHQLSGVGIFAVELGKARPKMIVGVFPFGGSCGLILGYPAILKVAKFLYQPFAPFEMGEVSA
jgi:hypothetical protein